MNHHGRMTYRKISIKEVTQWFYFLNNMEYTEDNIETEIKLLPSLLKMFSMFQMSFWYEKENFEENVV